MNTIGIYHKNCIDGTVAAAILLKKFPSAKLFPLGYDHTIEQLQDVFRAVGADGIIYTLDCSFGVQELLASGHQVITIDHHISVKERLDDLVHTFPKFSYIFNNNQSGASLSWAYLFPDTGMPEAVRFVEDGDLWKWALGEDTKHINNYLSLFIDLPEQMLRHMHGDISTMKEKGAIVTMWADKEIDRLVQTRPIYIQVGETTVPAVNITLIGYESACGSILSKRLGSVVVTFTIEGSRVRLSIRSQAHQKPTALDIARELGGGGHTHAAGAYVPLRNFLGMIIDAPTAIS